MLQTDTDFKYSTREIKRIHFQSSAQHIKVLAFCKHIQKLCTHPLQTALKIQLLRVLFITCLGSFLVYS